MDGRPARKEYRKFAIKTVEGANDFAMMPEVIRRRFRRAKDPEGEEAGKWTDLPDLVIVDGGKGQLNAALGALEEVDMQVSIGGLAKENEELFLPGQVRVDPAPARLAGALPGAARSGTRRTGSRSPSTGPSAVRRPSSPASIRFRASVRVARRR